MRQLHAVWRWVRDRGCGGEGVPWTAFCSNAVAVRSRVMSTNLIPGRCTAVTFATTGSAPAADSTERTRARAAAKRGRRIMRGDCERFCFGEDRGIAWVLGLNVDP